MALGALQTDILKLVVGQGMALVGLGLAAGLLLSGADTRAHEPAARQKLLFGVSATASLTFVGVTLLLATVALAACYIPALRASRIDPMVTLRNA